MPGFGLPSRSSFVAKAWSHRRALLPLAFVVSSAVIAAAAAPVPRRITQWIVRPSEGFDALCALNVLSGDPYYLSHFASDTALFAEPRYAGARAAAGRLRRAIKDEHRGIVSAFLTLILSGSADSTLAAVLASTRNPEVLHKAFRASEFWNDDSWALFERVRPDLVDALASMQAAGFPQDLARLLTARGADPVELLRKELSKYDVLGELQRLVGRELQAGRIEVILLYFSKPHGIRIQGGRFLTNLGYPPTIVLRNAAHEPLHPPFVRDTRVAAAALATLEADPLLNLIVAGHNPSFGYNRISGYVEENLVQGLEQIASERLGFAIPAERRWRTGDDGMHLLAAALYDLMRETEFATGGGRFEHWLAGMEAEGRLRPSEIERRAREVVGDSVVTRWKGMP